MTVKNGRVISLMKEKKLRKSNEGFYKPPKKKRKKSKKKLAKIFKVKNRLDTLTYAEFLQTGFWKKLRTKVFVRSEGLCEVCHNERAWQVHHMFYPSKREETSLNDLVAVCEECHKTIHETHGVKKDMRKETFDLARDF